MKFFNPALLRAITIFVACLGSDASASDTMAPETTWELLADNDEFAGINRKDRWYTSGMKFSRVTQAPLHSTGELSSSSQWTWRAIDTVCAGIGQQTQHTAAWSAGQNLYTQNLRTREIARSDDRPVGAYLYGSYQEHIGDGSESGSLSYELGITGPAALGEFVQNNLHDLIGRSRVPTWKFQLRPRVGVNLHLHCAQRWPVQKLNLMTGYSVSAGSSLVQGSAELALALGPGRNSVDFVRESRLASPTIHRYRGWNMIVGARIRWVAYDALIDGPTLGYRSQVNSRPQVGEIFLAFQFQPVANWRFQAAWIQRTMEFEGPGVAARNYEPQRFGSIRVSIAM